MELEEYAKMIPPPPADLLDWVRSQGYLNEQWMIYRQGWRYSPLEDRRHPCVDAVCTACGTRFDFDKVGGDTYCHNAYRRAPFGFLLGNHAVIDGDTERCPECDAAVKIRHCTNVSHGCDLKCAYPLVVSRAGRHLVLASYRMSAYPLEKEGRVNYSVQPCDAYVVDAKKIVRVAGYTRNLGGSVCWHNWQARVKYMDLLGSGSLNYPMAADVADGTFAENAKLREYMEQAGDDALPVSYLRLYLAHHNAENLVTAGLGRLLTGLLKEEASRTGYYNPPRIGVPKLREIDWKKVKPHEMLHMTKEQLRIAQQYCWQPRDLKMWSRNEELKAGLLLEEVQKDPLRVRGLMSEQGTLDRLQKRYGLGVEELVRYLRRQHARDNRADWHTLNDYHRMAEVLNMDLADRRILLPYDLMRFHDRAAAAMQCMNQPAMTAKFEEMTELLAPLTWEADGISIRAARSQKELSHEGAVLQHCVGTYGKQHCSGKSIFFIRRSNEPDKPWYTLNLDVEKGTVIQNRGLKNCARVPEIEAFEQRWLDEVVTPWVAAGCGGFKAAREEKKKKRAAQAKWMVRQMENEARKDDKQKAA